MSHTIHSEPSKGDNAPAGAQALHAGVNGQASPNLDRLLEDGEDAIAAPKDVLDDIASLVVSTEETALLGTKEILTNIAVRKPKKIEWFRTHPTAHYGPCVIFEVKVQMNTENYLVIPAVWNVFKDDLLKSHTKKVVLRVSITRGGLLFLNPIVAQDPLSKANDFNDTCREASILATTHWMRQEADMAQGKYRMWVAEGDYGEPVWPEFDLHDLIRKAFKGRVVASASHELLEQLRGRA
jgi:hypothetical protein